MLTIYEAAQKEKGTVVTLLATSENGLSLHEAEERKKRYGPNTLVQEKKVSPLFQFFLQFRDPLVLILLVAAGFSAGTGEYIDAGIILSIVLGSCFLNFFQEYRAKNAAEGLKKNIAQSTLVCRDGKEMLVPTEDLVPGDLMLLKAGSVISADGRIVWTKDFYVNESALTGESLPVQKVATPMQSDVSLSLSELDNCVCAGSHVESGEAHVLVCSTGNTTEFGKIAQQMQQETPSEFSRGIHEFGYMIMRLTVLLVVFIFLFHAFVRHEVITGLMFAIAVAVGLTPELLPMIMSVTMGKGAMNMAKKGVIVKKLQAIPNLGSMTVLCTDKTGTLTEGVIEVMDYVDIAGVEQEEVLQYAYYNSFFQSSIANPLDDAVLRFAQGRACFMKKIDEIPFDFVRRKLSVVVEDTEQRRVLITKGAPEELFVGVTSVWRAGEEPCIFDDTMKQQAFATYEGLSKDGYRVVALAKKYVEERKHYSVEDEQEMMLLGYVAFLDPAKKDVASVVQDLQHKGVDIKIITGDNAQVTEKICRDLQLPVKGILQGSQMHSISDEALTVLAQEHTIFARFSPNDKNRVIRALQKKGAVVGYMGDGINDAPSLKTADVGISVSNAVDVAKDAADIIITQKSLQVLLQGIEEGRRTFANSMKYIMMGVSSNFGNMFSVLGAVIFLPFLPMLPIHILLNNLLYDVSQMMLPQDYVDDEDIRNPRRWNMPYIKKFMYVFGAISSFFDFITFTVLIAFFHASESMFQTGWFMASLATQTFIIYSIRTKKIPFLQSTPHPLVMISTLLIVIIGWSIPYTPLATFFKFTPLSPTLLLVLAAITFSYLMVVEVVKKIFFHYIRA